MNNETTKNNKFIELYLAKIRFNNSHGDMEIFEKPTVCSPNHRNESKKYHPKNVSTFFEFLKTVHPQ